MPTNMTSSEKSVTGRVAHGSGWSAHEFVCTSGPGDRPFEERHEHATIACVLEGCFTYRAGNARAVLHAGALLLGNPGACYECGHEHGRGDRCLSIHFDIDFYSEIASGVSGSSAFRFPSPSLNIRPSVAISIERLASQASDASDPLSRDVAVAQLAELAIGAMSDEQTRTFRLSTLDERRVSRAVRYVEANVSETLDLDGIARAAGTSKYHFLRIFRRHVGVTPYRFVLDLRLRRAAVALAGTAAPVSTIAFELGFGDLSTFSRQFSAAFGASPQRYRRQERLPRTHT